MNGPEMRLFFITFLIIKSSLLHAGDDITCDDAYGYKYEQKGKLVIARAFSKHREYLTLCTNEKEFDYFVVLELRPQEIMFTAYIDPKRKSSMAEKLEIIPISI